MASEKIIRNVKREVLSRDAVRARVGRVCSVLGAGGERRKRREEERGRKRERRRRRWKEPKSVATGMKQRKSGRKEEGTQAARAKPQRKQKVLPAN